MTFIVSIVAVVLSVVSLVISVLTVMGTRRQMQRSGDNSTQVQVGSKHWHWDDSE